MFAKCFPDFVASRVSGFFGIRQKEQSYLLLLCNSICFVSSDVTSSNRNESTVTHRTTRVAVAEQNLFPALLSVSVFHSQIFQALLVSWRNPENSVRKLSTPLSLVNWFRLGRLISVSSHVIRSVSQAFRKFGRINTMHRPSGFLHENMGIMRQIGNVLVAHHYPEVNSLFCELFTGASVNSGRRGTKKVKIGTFLLI